MATTDARPGFRLPWTSDQRPTDEDGAPVADGAIVAEADNAPVASDETVPEASPALTPAPNPAPATAARSTARKPTKFLADLTKAMQAAAESAREETLSRFQADAKSFIEQIHSRSAEEATELRRRADDDVITIRDWSKAEIARIREETETRITDRKTRLEREVEDHAALVEGDIERVHAHVASFESQMAAFFERLLAEEDPTRFASMAENLPEPPSFDSVAPLATSGPAAEAMPAAEATPDAPAAETTEATEAALDADVAPEPDPWAGAAWSTETTAAELPEADPAEASAAELVAEEATAIASVEDELPAPEAAVLDEPGAAEPADDADPRLSALGLSADFAAAAEAASFAGVDAAAESEDFPELSEDAIAARLAGLVDGPVAASTGEPAAERSTRVVVVGLVSVASIASFKRHLGRLPGVASVGVSSGPDGEFVFAVTHDPDMSLTDAIPTLPGFQARVTGTGDNEIDVTAHDPESGA
jgi:hypothetical protein